jgi:replicative DNA helicase
VKLPHNWETERSLLGGLLLDNQQLPEVLERIQGGDFHKPAHQQLFELMVRMQDAGRGADLVAVLDEVTRQAEPDKFGGVAYIAGLPNACPSVENLSIYANRIREHAVRRRLVMAARTIVEDIQTGEKDLPRLLDDAEKSIFEISQLSGSKDWYPIATVVDEQILEIQRRQELMESLRRQGVGTVITGVPTGFIDLDRMLAGLQRTDLLILAARPAMGKTAFALNLALSAAQKGNVGVGVFSLEMGRHQLVQRLLCAHARVDSSKVRVGELDPNEDWRRISEAADMLHALPVYIDDTPGLSIAQLRSKARRLKSECPTLGLIVIDYLQLMQGSGGAKESREQVISNISRGLKILAKELEIPVLALSQLNRSLESRTDKRPMMSDLRESGAIEQDADVIMFIYRDEVYNEDSPEKGVAEIIVAKQRSGPIGTIKLAFLGQYTLFQNYADPSRVPGGYA